MWEISLGRETGHSVRQVVESMERVRGRRGRIREGQRRGGDPPVLVARCSRATELLNWRPRHSNLEMIVRTALRWKESQMSSGILGEPAGARTHTRRAVESAI